MCKEIPFLYCYWLHTHPPTHSHTWPVQFENSWISQVSISSSSPLSAYWHASPPTLQYSTPFPIFPHLGTTSQRNNPFTCSCLLNSLFLVSYDPARPDHVTISLLTDNSLRSRIMNVLKKCHTRVMKMTMITCKALLQTTMTMIPTFTKQHKWNL